MNTMRLILVLCGFFPALLAHAQPVYVPAELSPWQEWVLYDHDYVACPVSGKAYRCAWPGRLKLDVDSQSGRFRQVVEVLQAQHYILPGGGDFWPLDVTVSGKPVAVVERGERPAIFLEVGEHDIAGEFRWSRAPDTLMLGNGTGLLALTIEGKAIERPRWNTREVWISQGQQADTPEAQNQISTSVYRLISDGAPVGMTLKLHLDIAGESREETIGQLVPPGFTPAGLDAPLPARLDEQGNLKIQARPGSWTFTFTAHAQAPLERLVFSPRGEHWPTEEVWSYAAAPSVRATEVRASNAVDPRQAGVPEEWQSLPAFQMNADDDLTVIERQRGRAAGESNRLTLHRELWLDFDHKGYTARDNISGTMVRDWRLDLVAPFQLESASMQSPYEGQVNLLVTQNPGDSTSRGVELRTPAVDLSALARMESGTSVLPVAGWNARFDSVRTQLYLPPGHRLLGASNVDSAPGSWLARWNLLDFFVVMIVTVAVWRLIAPWAGVVALLALTLSFHESGAPYLAWLNLVAAFALAKYLPQSRLRAFTRSYSLLSLAAILLMLIPFSANALKMAVYPQLESRAPVHSDFRDMAASPPARDDSTIGLQIENMKSARPTAALEEVIVTGSKINRMTRYAANARVQTGPGVPSWGWDRNDLYWNGPVDVEQTSTLWIASPWMMRLWRVVMVGLLAALLAGFAGYAVAMRRPRVSSPTANSAVLLVAAILALTSAVPWQQVNADTPSSAILEQLRERLLKAPVCVPDCVDVSRARVILANDKLQLELIAHAQTYATMPLPGRVGTWLAETVTIDGSSTDDVRLNASGVTEIKLKEGVHRVVLSGLIPNVNSIGIAFPVEPHHIDVQGGGWEVTGVANNRLTGSALTLIRQQTGREPNSLDALDVEQFPSFVTVHRTLQFGLDWSVETTVKRETPPNAAINLSIPLLPGESITQDDIEVENGVAQISIPAGAKSISWSSTLVREPTMELVAAKDVPWQEHWQLIAGDSWRLEFSGVPELNTNRQDDTAWVARFTPWPGEKLNLNLSRPRAVDGATTAIDQVVLTETVGSRSSTVELRFSYRATRGTQHAIALPNDSELTLVSIDGETRNLALEGGQLRLPIVPGTHHVSMEWRSPGMAAFHSLGDAVDLGMPASNVTSKLNIQSNRWIVWTHGPQIGPAVLYWSELLAFFAIAVVLSMYGRTPLKLHHWILLGLGFSTFFWPAFAVVAAALLALAWRRGQTLDGRWAFNGTQVLLSALVIAAAFALIGAIPYGLLGEANMHITGNSSNATQLQWFTDQTTGILPSVGALSLPMWIYKVLILLWALWLAFALLKWLPWMWESYSRDGFWRGKIKIATPPDQERVIE